MFPQESAKEIALKVVFVEESGAISCLEIGVRARPARSLRDRGC